MGPFAGFAENREHMLRVLDMHRARGRQNRRGAGSRRSAVGGAAVMGQRVRPRRATFGVRNSQASVLAPTGTIGLLMDCDTTGIEPDLGLVKMKKLVGGGTMSIVNQTIPRALRRLGYGETQIDAIVAYIDEHKSILGAPHLATEHVSVFACSMGDNTIHYSGHVRMMGAVQPFISGAISKTVNMPEDVSVEDVEQLHIDAWRLGLKAVAIYRDNCKVAQPLSTAKKEAEKAGASDAAEAAGEVVERIVEKIVTIKEPVREKLPRSRKSRTFDFRSGGLQGLRHDRRVRRWPPGRDLHPHLEAGFDPRRDHGCLRHLGELRPPVRRAVARLCRDVHQHAVRARRHDRRPRHPVRVEPGRLHLPPAGGRVPHVRGAAGAQHPHDRASARSRRCRGSRKPSSRRCKGSEIAADPPSIESALTLARRSTSPEPTPVREPAERAQGALRRPAVHAVRGADAAGGLVSRLPQLRQHQRLQLITVNG